MEEKQQSQLAQEFIDEKPFDFLFWQIMGKSENWREEIGTDALNYFTAFKSASTFEDYLEAIAPPEESMVRVWWSMADFEEQERYINAFDQLKETYS